MAIRDFMGIEIPAFKRFYKDSKKTNVNMKNRCYWAEKEDDTYFCDGYMIIRFKNTSLSQVAKAFDLAYDDMPSVDKPAQDLAKVFSSFNPFEYDPAYVSSWSCACKRGGCKEPGFAKFITNEKSYCLIDEKFLPPFLGLYPRIKGENTGIMFQYGFDDAMTAFILPVRPDKENAAIYKAIQEKVMKEVEDAKNV